MSHYRWLLNQLTKWEAEGLLTAEAAARLRSHAEQQEREGGGGRGESRVAQVVMGALGALLVGAGVLALIAHNWDSIPRNARLGGSFVLLAAAQVLLAWVLRCGESAAQWKREAAGMFLVLAAGGCLALVSQIYNLGGDWPEFLFAWIVLAAPLLWAVRAHSVAVFHFVCIAIWTIDKVESSGLLLSPWLFPALLAAAIPYWPGFQKPRPALPGPVRWIAALCALAGFSAVAFHACRDARDGSAWLTMLSAACVAMLPLSREGVEERLSRKPQVLLGALYLFGQAFVLSHSWLSKMLGTHLHRAASLPWFWVLAFVFAVFFAVALVQKRWGLAAIATLALTPLLTFLFPQEKGGWFLSWFFTAHLFLIGLVMILAEFFGAKGAPRVGALLLAVLIVTRMADSELPLLTKAAVFIVVGVGFIAFNFAWPRLRAGRRAAA